MLRNVYVGGDSPYTLRNGWDAADAISGGWGKAEIDKLLSFAIPNEAANTNSKPSASQTTPTPESDI